MLNYKVDLRKLKGKNLSEDLLREAFGEIDELTRGKLMDISIDEGKRTVTLVGKDSNDTKRIQEWDLVDYIKTARQYTKLLSKVEREKDKYGITDSYNYEALDELVVESSRMVGKRLITRGLKNRLKTLEKVLEKDKITGKNKIEETQFNLQELRKLKYSSFNNPDEYMLKAGIDVSKFKTKDGRFKSKKAEREYLKLFSQTAIDEDYENSGEFSDFFGFVFDNYVDLESKQTTKSYWSSLKDSERSSIMREYLEERNIGNLNVDFDEEAELGIRRTLLKGKKK